MNDYEDSSDEAIEEDTDIPDSDAEQDPVVFSSNDEGSELEFESDYESANAEETEESTKSENDSCETTKEVLSTKLKNDRSKLTNNSMVKKSTIPSKSKTLAKKKIGSKNKFKNDKNQKDLQEIQTHRGDAPNKQETKNVDKAQQEEDEYEYDSSDEEDIRNTVGNVPMKWYDDYDHLGYNWDGKKILKPEKGDELDNFLKRMENPDFWRTIKDPQTGQDVVLSQEDIDLIVRIQKQKIPDVQFDEYAVSYVYGNLI